VTSRKWSKSAKKRRRRKLDGHTRRTRWRCSKLKRVLIYRKLTRVKKLQY